MKKKERKQEKWGIDLDIHVGKVSCWGNENPI